MKKSGTVLFIIGFAAGVVLSHFVGNYISDKAYKEYRAERFGKCISIAIDTVENKGLSVDGASEFITSNIWVAYELCDNPEISAELNNLWNNLVYEEEMFIGREDELVTQLKNILGK